jgi:glutathione synthase/RimK-type ligase-like ATP-grasp enzyme
MSAVKPSPRKTLAVLRDPAEALPPSSARAIDALARAANRRNIRVEVITDGIDQLSAFDGLFLRSITGVSRPAYAFARRAESLGLPVLDDSASIERCNKVYLAGVGLPSPKTRLMSSPEQAAEIAAELGFPVVLKVPDGYGSRGVVRAASLAEIAAIWADLGPLLVAQAFVTSTFDWRIGTLDGRPLWACQYRMVRGHWQVVKHGPDGTLREGGHTRMRLGDVPADVLDLAVRASATIGRGLYGVDIKDSPEGPLVIEVNDNPSLETGIEVSGPRDPVWAALLDWYAARW